MYFRAIFAFVIILMVGMALSPQRSDAHDMTLPPPHNHYQSSACVQFVQQVHENLVNCNNLGRNSACFGSGPVQVTYYDGAEAAPFEIPGDTVALADVQEFETAQLNLAEREYGVVLLNLGGESHGTTGEPVTILIMGNATMQNRVDPEIAFEPVEELVTINTQNQTEATFSPGPDSDVAADIPVDTSLPADATTPDQEWVRVYYQNNVVWVNRNDIGDDTSSLPVITYDPQVPFQEFNFATDIATADCTDEAPPSVIVLQNPTGVPVDIVVNGAPIRVESSIFLQTRSEQLMRLTTGEGLATVYPGTPNEVEVPMGYSVSIPVEEGQATGTWTDWGIDPEEFAGFDPIGNLPPGILPDGYDPPTIFQPSGVVPPDPEVVPPDGSAPPPVEEPDPSETPFPIPDYSYGDPGTGLEREEWSAISVNGPVCPTWVLYHSNLDEDNILDNDWDIYRLSGVVRDPNMAFNLSRGIESTDIQPTQSIDGEWVAFVSDRNLAGGHEIYIVRTDSTDLQRVTYNSSNDLNPVWGPEEMKDYLVFESNRDADWNLYIVNLADDGIPRRLTNDPGHEVRPFWAPTGEIYFQGDTDGDWEIYKLNPDTGAVTQLTDNDVDDVAPIVSHDGATMAWLRESEFGNLDLWIMDLDTDEETQLTDTGTDIGSHLFSPDDTFIAYHTNIGDDFDVYAIDLETEIIKNLTDNTDYDDLAPTFRCEDRTVIYHSNNTEDENFEIFEVDPDPIEVDGDPGPYNEPEQLTFLEESTDVFPEGDPREESNSLLDQFPEVGEVEQAE